MRHAYIVRILITLFVSFLILPSNGIAAEAIGKDSSFTAKTIRNSSFYYINYFELLKSQEVPSNLKIIPIKAGTEFELLAYDKFKSESLQVRAKDGSIGWVPANAFANAKLVSGDTLSICQIREDGSSYYPEKYIKNGEYSVVVSDAYVYETDESIDDCRIIARPRKAKLVGNGVSYDITCRYNPYFTERNKKNHYKSSDKLYSLYSYGAFDQILDKLPKQADSPDKFYRYNLKKHNLEKFVGYHKDYLESIIGPPDAYGGPEMTGSLDSTFVIYRNVVWAIGGRKLYRGLTVKFDRDSIIRSIELAHYGWVRTGRGHKIRHMYVPFKQAIDGKFMRGIGSSKVVHKSFFYNTFNFYDEVLEIHNRLAMLVIMLLIQIVFGLILAAWIILTSYGSHLWTEIRSIALPLCLAAFNIVNFANCTGLFWAIVSSPFIIAAGFMTYHILSDKIGRERCPECHKFVDPEVVSSKEGLFRPGDYEKTNQKECMDSWRERGGNDMAGFSINTKQYKYETMMSHSQDMNYKVKCPRCGKIWSYDCSENRGKVRGPIMIEVVEVTKKHSTVVTTKTTELRYGSTTLDRDENTSYDTDTDTYTDIKRRLDKDRYVSYYRAYINGDRDALNRYYKDCWDNVTLKDCS